MTSPLAISTAALTKRYGSARGILELDLEVRAGEVFGFLGPNGAGKTTTIRLLLDFIRPTHGQAKILGLDCQRDSIAVRRQVGYLPGEFTLYGNLTGAQLLRYLGSLRGGVEQAVVRQLADRLGADLTRKLRQLSHGNRQKIGLIQAMMAQPALLILDEPTTGLDPLVQRELHSLLDEVRQEGRTVFFSSHVLPDVERVCDRVGIVRDGRLVAVETVENIRQSAIRKVELRFQAPADVAPFAALAGVRDVAMEGNVVRLTVIGSMQPLLDAAARHAAVDLISHEPSLEEAFLSLYGGATSGPRGDDAD